MLKLVSKDFEKNSNNKICEIQYTCPVEPHTLEDFSSAISGGDDSSYYSCTGPIEDLDLMA